MPNPLITAPSPNSPTASKNEAMIGTLDAIYGLLVAIGDKISMTKEEMATALDGISAQQIANYGGTAEDRINRQFPALALAELLRRA